MIKFLLLILFTFFQYAVYAQNLPNIIIIFADDLGYGELGCYGQKVISTPNLDALAAQGLRLTDFYSGSALCAPARCQLLTGLHSGHSFVRANYEMSNGPKSFTDDDERGQLPLADSSFTIAKALKSKGYQTACIGKWGLGMSDTPGNPNLHGFDYFFGYLDQKQAHNYYPTHLWENGVKYPLKNKRVDVHQKITANEATDSVFSKFVGIEYSVDVMSEKVKKFIDLNSEKKFFLYYALTLPHLALQVPESALQLYKGKFPETAYYGENGYCPSKFPRATYAAMVSYLDTKVGELMEQLKQKGIDQNTLVIFTSDNGSAFKMGGNDPEFFKVNGLLRDYKGALYEGGIRVPFIAWWPGRIKPGVNHTPIAAFDILATLTDLSNIKVKNTDGISFLPILFGKKIKPHPFFYFELFEYGGQQAIRLGNWKAIKRNMRKDKHAPWELYNLSNDPSEKNNLAGQHPEIIRQVEGIAKQQHRHSLITDWNFMED